MSDRIEPRVRAALDWAIAETCLALPHGQRYQSGWDWNAGDMCLERLTGDGQFRFHVGMERRGGRAERIAVLSWEDDDGKAVWEATLPGEVPA